MVNKWKEKENIDYKERYEILKKYIDAAPRQTFQDIFDAIDSFIYFENRKK